MLISTFKRALILVLILTGTITPLFGEIVDLTEEEILAGKNFYSRMSIMHKKDTLQIFDSYPIYTNVKFRISPTADNILDKMFSDLYYTGRVGKVYANSPYDITRQDDYYKARIRDLVDGSVHPIKTDKRKNNYVYLVKGVYDTFITLRGKMIVDVKYNVKPYYVGFDIKVYVIIDNSYMWRLARYIKSLPAFQSKIERLIRINVLATIRLGKKTVMGIKKDLKKKEF